MREGCIYRWGHSHIVDIAVIKFSYACSLDVEVNSVMFLDLFHYLFILINTSPP